MIWQDEGILLNLKRFSENNYIATFFSPSIGLSKGLVRETKGLFLMEGDSYFIRWKARLSQQLGTFQVERLPQDSNENGVLFTSRFLSFMRCACDLCYSCLPEAHVYELLYRAIRDLARIVKSSCDFLDILRQYCDFERLFLQELGYGLDISCCTVSKKTDDLFYLSPKTGRAVSYEVGKPYANKLFKIPKFWLEEQELTIKDLENSLSITDYFLKKHLLFGNFSNLNRELVFNVVQKRLASHL